MPEVHKYIGFAVVAVFAVGWIWGLGAFVFRRVSGPGERFWTWLTVAQVVAGLQVLAGVVLLLMGKRPSTWLHYVYGVGPLAILALAHWLAREGQKVQEGYEPIPPYLWFSGAAFICFGLTLRALMTGLGYA
jgi:zinc transporter ZupT